MGRSSYCLNLSWSIAAAAALLACGGSQPAASAPGEPGAAPAAEESPAPDAWSDSMSDQDKAAFMKKKVVPPMSKAFKEHDAKEFADFGCKTCHGPQFKPHPVDFLPELHFTDGKLKEAAEHPEMAKFMHDVVVPQMAEIFGKKPYDPATKEGFGCAACHKIAM